MTNEEFIKSVSEIGEEWKDVVGFEGMYKISSYGKLLSVGRIVVDINGRYVTINPRIIKPCLNFGEGYYNATLWKGNRQKHKYIHRLVAEAFVPNPNNYEFVDHIDTDRLNNKAENLRWCSPSMNNLNPVTNAKFCKSIKDSNRKRLQPIVGINIQNPEIKIFYNSIKEAESDGFSSKSISSAINRRLNMIKHKGYIWFKLSDFEKLINISKNEPIQAIIKR